MHSLLFPMLLGHTVNLSQVPVIYVFSKLRALSGPNQAGKILIVFFTGDKIFWL